MLIIDAVGERLLLGFADGSKASLRPRTPTTGAAVRVAALAAPALERQRLEAGTAPTTR